MTILKLDNDDLIRIISLLDFTSANNFCRVTKSMIFFYEYCKVHTNGKKVKYCHWDIDTAAENNHVELVEQLHKDGKEGSPYAMFTAASKGYLRVVKYLLKINSPYNNKVMNYAAEYGHLNVLKYLVKMRKTSKNCTHWAMTYAVKNRHFEVVKYLHKIGATCSTYAIYNAVKNKDFQLVKYLISIGKKFTIISKLYHKDHNYDHEIYHYLCNHMNSCSPKYITSH